MKARLAVAALSISAAGLAFISQNEGREREAYRDPVGVWTVCDGHTKTARPGMVASDALCDKLLREDTAEAQAAVKRLVKVQVTQGQYDALVDFTFNKGAGNLASSTLLRKANAGDCWGAGAEFPKWVYAKGVRLRGLEVRAEKQRKMWEAGC